MVDPSTHKVLKRVPDGHRISKRPLLRPPIPSPYTNAKQQKCVYISARSPFISTVKRVRKLQKEITKRGLGKFSLLDDEASSRTGGRSDRQKLQQVAAKNPNPEPVYLRGTGKAIEKVLSLGLYFQNQDDCRIELKTYTLNAVDDIEKVEEVCPKPESEASEKMAVEGREEGDEAETSGPLEADLEYSRTQVRGVSGLEVAVYLLD